MFNFGENLKKLREENNLSIQELAEKINVSKSSISRWENEISDIKSEEILKLAKFFDVSTDFLLGLEDF